ncbi:GAF sensor signal transduction histidine kinase [Malonomonas rubra DSM 5091]|uniref:histidine kinase n=1 Tax=Malonomonas rubra DSM 5091 TaxID=1122189 RepID=A0A1M6GEJ7_MALRU|nr:ATP-binding protein [Malonomonas rubra]SHJ08390.1 GAF sensor signal transduction histidine kinase [Malonomonas rubra DSM 5091]
MDSTNRRLAQLTLLTQLGQALNAANSLHSLCTVTSQLLLDCEQVTGVIIRPRLYGNPPPRNCYCQLESTDPALRIFLQQQDCQLSNQVLHQGKQRLYYPLSNVRHEQLPASIYSLPLRIHDRNFGTLSFFGGSPNGHLPFDEEQIQFFQTCAFQIAQAFEQLVTVARLRQVSASDFRRLQDLSLLYRITQLLHSTLSPNELLHLILSLLVSPDGGSFHRAMLFMVNPRSGTMQGILGVTRESVRWLLPDGLPPVGEPAVNIPEEAQQAQREDPFSRKVMQQRIDIANNNSCLAIAAREKKAMLITREQIHAGLVDPLCEKLHSGHHATIPLLSRGRTLSVLAVDNGDSGEAIDAERLRFLEMFAGQAGIALDNAQLLQRVETAHRNLRETQEQLLQKEKLATIGEMSASIAHELKNPLVSVGGFARRLTKSLDEQSPSYKYADIIQQESERLEKMLDNILSFSKQHLLCIREYRLEQVLDRTLVMEAEKLQRANIELQLDLIDELPQMQGDAEQLEQVFINLITNAKQAMNEGGILQIKSSMSRLRGEPAVRIEFHDSGGGIPPKLMRNIFNPFFTTKEEGTGLGLPISHRIIEHHQGEIEAINTASGACFSVILPVRLNQISADPVGQMLG